MKNHLLIFLLIAALFVQCRTASNEPRFVTDILPTAPDYSHITRFISRFS